MRWLPSLPAVFLLQLLLRFPIPPLHWDKMFTPQYTVHFIKTYPAQKILHCICKTIVIKQLVPSNPQFNILITQIVRHSAIYITLVTSQYNALQYKQRASHNDILMSQGLIARGPLGATVSPLNRRQTRSTWLALPSPPISIKIGPKNIVQKKGF